MNNSLIIHAGIFYNAIISAIVAASAAALGLFLLWRWGRLTSPMRGYAFFWIMTSLIWIPASIRYFLISTGYTGAGILHLAMVGQTAVAASGPPLLYYLLTHLNASKKWALALPTLAAIIGGYALWVDLLPGGIVIRPMTYFSSELTFNRLSLTVFFIIVGVIFSLALYDTLKSFRRWRDEKVPQFGYEALYSLVVLIYLALGSIEEAGIISNWTVIAFRSLYVLTFLYVYIIMDRSESSAVSYLVDTEHETK